MLEKQESQLSQRVEENSESIQKLTLEINGLHDKVEAAAEHIVTRVEDVDKNLSREAARLDDELHTVTNDFGGRMETLDRKVVQVNEQRQQDRERLSASVAEVQNDVRAAFGRIIVDSRGDRLEVHRRAVADETLAEGPHPFVILVELLACMHLGPVACKSS